MPNPYETWRKYSPHEVIIFPKFHKDWEKIVDFLPEHLDFTFSRLGWTGLYANDIIMNYGYFHWFKSLKKSLGVSFTDILVLLGLLESLQDFLGDLRIKS